MSARKNKTPHNRHSKIKPEKSLKPKLRARSKGKSARAKYIFKNAQIEQDKFKKLYDHMILSSELTTLNIGQAQSAYTIAITAAKNGNYNKAMIFFMLAAATILAYSPKTPNTTGYEDTASVISTLRLPQGNLAVAVEYKAKELFGGKIKNLEEQFTRSEWRELKKQKDRKEELKKKADELQVLLSHGDKQKNKTWCKNCDILGGGGSKNVHRRIEKNTKTKEEIEVDVRAALAVSKSVPRQIEKNTKTTTDKYDTDFVINPPEWVRNYLYGRPFNYVYEQDDPGEKIWIIPHKYAGGNWFEKSKMEKRKLFNLMRIPDFLYSVFINGQRGEWKLLNSKSKDRGFPNLQYAAHRIEGLTIFKEARKFIEQKKKCLTEKDFNLPNWKLCKTECFDTIIEFIKGEMHSTVYMLRLISNSLLSSNPDARVRFEFIEEHESWNKLTGLWEADKQLFKLMPFEDNKKTPRLIMSYGPSAAGKTFNAKKIIKLIADSDPNFPTAFIAIDGGIAREMSVIYQMVVAQIHLVSDKMSGFANLVSAGLSRHKSLFNSEPKKQLQDWLKAQAIRNTSSFYIPTTATGELTQSATLKKAHKISKWDGLNDDKWIGLLIYQHKTHSDCPFKHKYKCNGCTESGVQRQIGEGKEYSSSAYKMAFDHGEHGMQNAPGGRIKIHNSGGYKHDGEFAKSIIVEYPHGKNKDTFLLANQIKTMEDSGMEYMQNDKTDGFCFWKKKSDIPYKKPDKKPGKTPFFKCMPPGCMSHNDSDNQIITEEKSDENTHLLDAQETTNYDAIANGGQKKKTRRNRSKKYNKHTRKNN
ncbi:MAG: hypothetical protein CXT73_05870 [Methanobacteriota archaeon]|nr:MAG: hypothetical protein CXT73_05870 [Euryarchaeota archaeon]